jgi:hypothetical protein
MPSVGFEPATPAFELAKTIHVLDRATTVIGTIYVCQVALNVVFLVPYHRRFMQFVSTRRTMIGRLVAGFPPCRPGFGPRSCNVEFLVDKSSGEAGFLGVLRFPLPILNPLTVPNTSSSSWGW